MNESSKNASESNAPLYKGINDEQTTNTSNQKEIEKLEPNNAKPIDLAGETSNLAKRKLTSPEFQALAEVPPEVEWFANLKNKHTRRAYRNDVRDFMGFVGIESPQEFRLVTRSHVIAWRDELIGRTKERVLESGLVESEPLSASTIRRKLSALSSLFQYLCENNAVTHNPVKGVSRPNEGSNEGKTSALGDAQARRLLSAPDPETLKGKRDRAILSVLFFHAVRREEVANLRLRDMHQRQGVLHFRIRGKRDKVRYLPVNPSSQRLINEYLEASEHSDDKNGPLFRPITNNVTKTLRKHLHPDSIYRLVRAYAKEIGLEEEVEGRWVHLARATAITNALENEADIAKVQEWAGHANIATTRLYDRRKLRPEDSPTFKVRY